MSDEIIITAKSVEEALAKAEAEYGAKGELTYDILEMPKKGFLGIGEKPAKIRVTVGSDDGIGEIEKIVKSAPKAEAKPAPKAEVKPAPKAEAKPEVKPAPKAENKPEAKPAPKAENKPEAKPAPKTENKPAPKTDAKPEAKSEPKPKQPKQNKQPKANKDQPRQDKPEKSESESRAEKAKKKERAREDIVISQEEMDLALSFINTLLRDMESEAVAVQQLAPEGAVFEGVYPKIEITGDESGILIGHHGETLDAIQFLANLCVNRKTGASGREFVKIVVDIENYRAKREETLRALARRMAQKALKYKRNVVLEPMNPYERHIIHAELQDMENIDTHSVGSDENRKVVITYEGEDKQEQKRTGNRRRNDRGERTEHKAPVHKLSEEESARIQETYAAYQEEKAGRERPKRATSIDEILGSSDDPEEPIGM